MHDERNNTIKVSALNNRIVMDSIVNLKGTS